MSDNKTYRLYCEAVKSASLGSSVTLRNIPCDRNAKLASVVICSRAGITANSSNYSKLQIKKGSDVIFERSFETDSLAAVTNEALAPLLDSTVSASDELIVHYAHVGSGLAIDLDCLLVFELARG